MCEDNLTPGRICLKNSKAVNKPFRSPFSNATTSYQKDNHGTPELNSCNILSQTFPKRKPNFGQTPIAKKLKLEFDSQKESVSDDSEAVVCYNDLEAIKRRVQHKQRCIEQSKNRSLYCKKHNAEDLERLICTWRKVCQEALERLHKDAQKEHMKPMSMNQLLSTLGIPADLVGFSIESETFN